ncbi:uncharacterized protein LOC141852494 [Brevipalpus obovatus]|uniref:uncharacterized protein LOC141852494 n=1 Tax=Brevipalpus obovatus TaxID=246614 RepID=UPI003D9E6B32
MSSSQIDQDINEQENVSQQMANKMIGGGGGRTFGSRRPFAEVNLKKDKIINSNNSNINELKKGDRLDAGDDDDIKKDVKEKLVKASVRIESLKEECVPKKSCDPAIKNDLPGCPVGKEVEKKVEKVEKVVKIEKVEKAVNVVEKVEAPSDSKKEEKDIPTVEKKDVVTELPVQKDKDKEVTNPSQETKEAEDTVTKVMDKVNEIAIEEAEKDFEIRVDSRTSSPGTTVPPEFYLDESIDPKEADKENITICSSSMDILSTVEKMPPESMDLSNTIESKPADMSHMSVDSTYPDRDDLCFDRILEYDFPLYEEDIHVYLIKMQERVRVDPNYMSKHEEVLSKARRAVLVDWMIDVVEEYRMTSETLFLAVNIVDRFLNVDTVTLDTFQTLGCTALFISSKYEEIYPPEIQEFVYITDNASTKEDILNTERKILNTLDFVISGPTVHYFLRKYLYNLTSPSEFSIFLPQIVGIMAEYLCYLTILNLDMLAYLPNDLAIAAIIVSASMFGIPVPLENFKYHSTDIVECIEKMHQLRKAPKNTELSAYRKYSRDELFSVALMEESQQES